MTREEAESMSTFNIYEYIKENFEPVDDKPGYVWFNKRNFQIINIETLAKSLKESTDKMITNEDYRSAYLQGYNDAMSDFRKKQYYKQGYEQGVSDVLDKIKVEIEQVTEEESKFDKKWAQGLKYALKIIDKYKVES